MLKRTVSRKSTRWILVAILVLLGGWLFVINQGPREGISTAPERVEMSPPIAVQQTDNEGAK